jgi:hypothetical protein
MLPASFLRDGFTAYNPAAKYRRLMVGLEGESDTGKTEFCLSAPDPGIVLALDRNFDATLDNPSPPAARRKNWAFKVVQAPLFTQAQKPEYDTYWKAFYQSYRTALLNPDARTIVLDGDSDSWELQRLAEFGTLTRVPGPPGLAYAGVNAARRAMIARAWDSGKIVLATNKVKSEYKTVLDEEGKPKLDNLGKEVREKTGKLERQGFGDTDYLWQIQLLCLRRIARINPVNKKLVPQQWGVRLLKCKANTELEGSELWGEDCNFLGLVQYVYPHIDPKEWGF